MERPRQPVVRALTRVLSCAIALCAMTVTSSCKDSVDPVPTGTLSGTVVLQDSWATRLDNFAGVSVTVDGVPTIAVTDASGAWQVDGVSSGKHDITFTKATFGTVRLTGQAVTSPSTVAPAVTMGVTPWQQAIIDSVYLATRAGKDYYVVDGHLSAAPGANARLVLTVALFGKTAAVSPDLGGFDMDVNAVSSNGQASTFSMSLLATSAQSAFGSGSHVFVTTYVSAMACTCYAIDLNDKPFFSNTGPRANVVQLTIK
jgi:hypothetical protein